MTTIVTTVEALEDAPYTRWLITEYFRTQQLAMRGFLGQVRCALCHRKLRCVSLSVGSRFYGKDCAERVA